MPTDPICGMEVEEEKAAATSEYKGKTYYFCANSCKETFEKDPEKYTGAGKEERTVKERTEDDRQNKTGEVSKKDTKRIDLPIRGMHCASCASKIEKELNRVLQIPAADSK